MDGQPIRSSLQQQPFRQTLMLVQVLSSTAKPCTPILRMSSEECC
jgi:hypothetical protein